MRKLKLTKEHIEYDTPEYEKMKNDYGMNNVDEIIEIMADAMRENENENPNSKM